MCKTIDIKLLLIRNCRNTDYCKCVSMDKNYSFSPLFKGANLLINLYRPSYKLATYLYRKKLELVPLPMVLTQQKDLHRPSSAN